MQSQINDRRSTIDDQVPHSTSDNLLAGRRGDGGRLARLGNAEHRLAVLALDHFAAEVIGHAKDFATTKIGAD
jgi:hypothetical protein